MQTDVNGPELDGQDRPRRDGMPREIRDRLVSAAVEFDRRASRRPGHNPYALAHYLGAISDASSDMGYGDSLEDAIRANFCDRLLTAMEKAAGIPVSK